ncbi:MAG TPA: histidine kinase, partial [Bacteroidia bacterium]|nr:histidine kinase [Bacteroidia bacterium]
RELGTANTPPSSGFIYLLNKTSTSQLLVGTTRSYFYPVNGSLETPDPAKYRDNHPEMIIPAPFVVKCAATRPDGHFWVGNYLYLSEVDPQNKKIISQCKPPSRILSMICTDNKTVWLGCLNGLWKYQNGVFTYLGDSLPIFQTRIEDMKLNKDGTWWFATRGKGLILKKGKQIFNLSERNGLSSNVCSSIYIDSEGIIWVATNKGIDRIISEAWGSYQIRSYSMEDGLVSNEINQVVRMGNDIWAGSNQGLIRFPALVDNAYGSPPPVYITGLSVNSVEYALKDSLNFKHNQNFLQISFLGLSYRGRIPVNYKYRLEGLEDTAWAYTSGMSIQYTNLPPGNYTFKTYAINSHGQISPNPASLSFSIAKPFWAETWFRLLAALFISGLILSIFMLRLRTLKRKILEKAVINQRITEMELKALRAQMNPHFIFNCISSIQYYVLANDAESADRYLSKFSKLIRNVLTNSKQERISLETELQTLELYIQLESMRFSSKFSYRIEIDSDLQTGCVSIPPLILQPYVENAIWHGLMHLTERNGELVIRLDKKETEVHCIIEDNGIGRKKNQELKKNNTHKSFGLTITRERLAFMNKRQLTEEGIKIIDKYNEDGVPEGTRIELLLPLEQLNEDTIL